MTRPRWIISASQDLLWIHGSVAAGLALLVFFTNTPSLATSGSLFQPALVALVVWGVAFDGTHVLGTYARSYWAGDAASRAQLPGPWSWSLLAVGPALAFWPPGFSWFLLGAYLWAYYHLVRQHWGFVALYRRRATGTGPAWLDAALLATGTLYPYAMYALGDDYSRSGLPVLLAGTQGAAGARVLVSAMALTLGAALLCVWALQVWRGLVSPGPQHALIAVVVAFHAAVFACLSDLLAITATLTIFHNLQYHRIVWHYEAGQGRRPLGGVVPYLAAGLVFGACWYGARLAGVRLGSSTVGNVLLGLGWGVALHHYLVDGRIWRVRRSPAVGAALDAATLQHAPPPRPRIAAVLVAGNP